ncbi:MAG: DNA primase [Parcubacteria bacterium C7867-007]|nr:MAG: DNA primase [Parcubacteria bacterium C7867-007]
MKEMAGEDTVQQVKDKLSIVEVISPYVKLTKAGKYYRGLSPFNKEKTPSFYVNPERGSYYCFSSSQGGDQFSFIQAMEGVDFKGALKILAEKAGIEIVYQGSAENRASKDRVERLREAMGKAEVYFSTALGEGTDAYAYAAKRGLTKETIAAWNLGLAPDGWRSLLESLTSEGFTLPELTAAGLVKEADEKRGTFYDRFRNRLMFPIRDAAGRTVAFTGRALSPDDQAKYLNSPETDLFKKSEVLFGMDRAKDAIRQRGFAILVEGQFDLILLHQAGFTNTIALSGTALSTQHLSLIKRYADNLMLCLDSDRAGLAASAKSARAALLAGMRVKAIRMPEGKDPADIVSEDAHAFTNLAKDAKSIIEFFLAVLSAQEKDETRLLRAVEGIVLPLVVAVKSSLEQNRFIDIIARAVNSTPEAVRRALPRLEVAPEEKSPLSVSTLSGSAVPSSVLEVRRGMVIAVIQAYAGTALADRLKTEYTRITGADDSLDLPVDERALFEAGLTYGETPDQHAGDELLQMFEQTVLSAKLNEATKQLRTAEAQGDQESITEAMHTFRALSAQLATLNSVR